jgi:hypothetical protein
MIGVAIVGGLVSVVPGLRGRRRIPLAGRVKP